MKPVTMKSARKYLRKEFKPASLKEASIINYVLAIQAANVETINAQRAVIKELENEQV